MSAEEREVKVHITGTPAQLTRRARKFGTVLQPSLLAMESPVPQSTIATSSTPLRGGKRALPDAEATPIRAPGAAAGGPVEAAAPLSPAPEMVTGGLAKLCAIM